MTPGPQEFGDSSDKKMALTLEKQEFEKAFVRNASKLIPDSVFWSTKTKPVCQTREASCIDARLDKGVLFEKEGSSHAWTSFYIADSMKRRQMERRKRAVDTRFKKDKQMNSTFFESKCQTRLPARLHNIWQNQNTKTFKFSSE